MLPRAETAEGEGEGREIASTGREGGEKKEWETGNRERGEEKGVSSFPFF